MKTINTLAAAVLLVSALIGIYILLTDSILWQDAPTHADGLIAFVILDLGLVVGLWWKLKLATLGMTLLALIQFGAMGADVFVGQSMGTTISTQTFLQHHLLGDAAFLSLLGVQAVIVVVGIIGIVMMRRAPQATTMKPDAPATTPSA
ncbi:MAG: hypothetical protein OK441_06210 [Thaumarchaeota archaeon]|nr:hypothetical protein [Nitrososphaerota archaeon]